MHRTLEAGVSNCFFFFLNSNGVVNKRCRIQEECAEAKANQPGLHLLAGGNRLDSVIVFLSVCM